MNYIYIKGLGIPIGAFDEDELKKWIKDDRISKHDIIRIERVFDNE